MTAKLYALPIEIMTAIVRLTSRRALPEIATLFPATGILSNVTPIPRPSFSRRRTLDEGKSRNWRSEVRRSYATRAKSEGKSEASDRPKSRKTPVAVANASGSCNASNAASASSAATASSEASASSAASLGREKDFQLPFALDDIFAKEEVCL